jgi:transmembrane sensor
MEDAKIIALMEGYKAGTLTDAEAVAFYQWYSEAGMEQFQRVYAQYHLQSGEPAEHAPIPNEFRLQLEEAIRDHEAQQEIRIVPIFRRYRIAWAAAIILFIAAGGYLFIKNRQDALPQIVNTQPVNDAVPGTTKAVLTLADGRKVIIDSVQQGRLAIQGTTTVQREQGVIAYNVNEPGKTQQGTQSVLYNTLTTARGEQSPPLVLNDGTKVWLNAMSSIRFPVVFTGNTRTVEITGEAYFEVAKNKAMPFHVKVNTMDVEALGTQFNINSYADEPDVRTTLLEGSVKVVNGEWSKVNKTREVILQPGEQAIAHSPFTSDHSPLTIDHSPNIDQAIAWKRGLFDFNHASLQTVLRQLARWYDIEVHFEGNIPNRSFRGKITRDLNLSQVISILQDLDIKFRIEGKKLFVSP